MARVRRDAADEHIGSADIDFCLSVAITQGETRQYYKSIEELLSPHFELASSSGFRWRKKDGVGGLPLAIDFLAPARDRRYGLTVNGRIMSLSSCSTMWQWWT